MDLDERRHGEVVILQPRVRRLEASNAQALTNELIDRISQGKNSLVLDLNDVDFMDSSALASLLSAVKSLGTKGRMALFGISSKVRKLFSITRLDNVVFILADSEEEAVRSVQGASGLNERL